MGKTLSKARFQARLLQPAKPGADDTWCFLVLPKEASDILPRRGRTTVYGTINEHDFQAMLEPDGQLSHWLKVSQALRETIGAKPGDMLTLEIRQAKPQPEPEVPDDLQAALADAPKAQARWNRTTTVARIDWIHWVVSAKQAKTRAGRIEKACDMLTAGKSRVCCFDPSGFYSKSLSAPEALPGEPT